MDVLLDVVLDLRFGETGRAYIVDRRGYVVAYPEEVTMSDATIASRPETRAAIQAVEGGWSGTYLNFEGQQVLGIALPISDTGWTILTEVAESEATAATRQASIVLGGGVLFFGLVVLLVTNYLMLNLVLRPVEELRDGAERVGRGDLDCRLDSQRPDEIGQVAAAFNEMAARLQQRETALAETQERLRDALGRYVAPQLADEVMAHGASLGGETVSASVLFADIRGFTTLSEKLSPKLVVDLLNRYFAAVEPVIAAEGGWIAKFGGDSLLAVFGAPAPQADHARRAVRAALRIRDALEEFNREQRRHEGPTLRVGIGITCGEMVAGSVGSPQRMEYTVVGDIVNTASRIDDLNKTWSTDLLVSAAVYEQVAPYVSARPMPPIEVEGKSEVMQLYAIAVEAMHIMIPLIDV